MTDGDRAKRDGSVALHPISQFTIAPQSAKRLRHVPYIRSHLAPLDPPSSGPIGRSKNARLSTGYVATLGETLLRFARPRKGGKGLREKIAIDLRRRFELHVTIW
jgi:hypothetical protein